jgi:hypothetical protein
MTQQELIDMAFKVGIKYRGFGDEFYSPQSDGVEILQMEAFAKLIAAKEREACAKTVADLRDKSGVNEDGNAWLTRVTKGDCVQAIRERGEA